MKSLRRFWIWSLLAVLVLGLAAVLVVRSRTPSAAQAQQAAAERWLTQAVEVGDVRRSISATGALQPVSLVQVGSTVSGTIKRLAVDYNATVQAGQLLAEIDTTALDAELAQVQAQRASAQATLELAQSQAQRQQRLFDQGYVSRADADTAGASARSAQAAVAQQDAALQRARFNRRNAEIRSPVAGTVISREVSLGQTVAASLQAPVLFKIAQDLREMQIEASVAEADVGLLQEGQPVRFTVDAFPERAFEGRVRQIRNNHQVQQNVVTYTAVITARNDDLVLRPGMTAYVQVTVGERSQVLRIPNAALRYTKTEADGTAAAPNDAPGQRTVWRVSPGNPNPQPVVVTLGLAEGRWTEQLRGGLQAGDRLVIGERKAAASFGPKFF
jgi:HlyD family secretion protein